MLKAYELISPYVENPIHAIFYYNVDSKKFGLFVPNEVKSSELPIIFRLYVENGIRNLNDEQTRRWIKDRIVPPERQNIGMILKNVGIDAYDEFAILIYCKGKSCMDDFYLEECDPKMLYAVMSEEDVVLEDTETEFPSL